MKFLRTAAAVTAVLLTVYCLSVVFISYRLSLTLKELASELNAQQYETAVHHLTPLQQWGEWWLMITRPLTLWSAFGDYHQLASSALNAIEKGELLYTHSAAADIISGISLETIQTLQHDWNLFMAAIDETVTRVPSRSNVLSRFIPQQIFLLPTLHEHSTPYKKVISEFLSDLPVLLGHAHDQEYIVLFQNNMELRPTGGFMGSYASVKLSQGSLRDVKIQDIYVPDGQIKGYVKEPLPIKKYLFNDNHPGWRLRDANWHPDFRESAQAIDWFFVEGGLSTPDGYIAINLYPIIDALQAIGGVSIPDYQLRITADNFYQEAQRHAEENFFPGSTQKRDFLHSVGTTILYRLTHEPELIRPLLPVLFKNLQEKHISMYIRDGLKVNWHALGWDGSLAETADEDYMSINEANVGVTKANCCIDRKLSDEITITDSTVLHHMRITYTNHNPPVPNPPHFWGGGYKNYLRIITPRNAILDSVEVNGKRLPASQIDLETLVTHKQAVGFLVLTEGGHTSEVTVSYSVPKTSVDNRYRLRFQKQSGVATWPATFIMTNTQESLQKNITTDEMIEMSL